MPKLKTVRFFQRSSQTRYMSSYGPVMPTLLIRRTVFRDINVELLEDLSIDSYQQNNPSEPNKIEVDTKDDGETNPLRKFWTHEKILEVDAFFRHSDGDGEGQPSMLA